MEKLKKYIVENYNNKFTFEHLMSEGIPKLFLKIEAVKKEIAKLEAEEKRQYNLGKLKKTQRRKKKS